MAYGVSVLICSTGNTDQLSVKDSGKGDSDFNDSDSDISGDGGKRSFSTFHPRLKSKFLPPLRLPQNKPAQCNNIPFKSYCKFCHCKESQTESCEPNMNYDSVNSKLTQHEQIVI